MKKPKSNSIKENFISFVILSSATSALQQFTKAIHSGVFTMDAIISIIILGIFAIIGIFAGKFDNIGWLKKLGIQNSTATKILVNIKNHGTIYAMIVFFIISAIIPSLAQTEQVQSTNLIGNTTSYQDGIHGNIYVNKTLGFKIERPDDTWIFMTDIPKLRQTYGTNPNPIGVLGGVIVAKSFTHEGVSIWVLDPVAVGFTNMSDLINRTLTALPPVVHSQLYNIHEDISPQGDYGTYTFNSNYSNGIKLYYDTVIQMSNGKLYEREILSNMSNILAQDESIKFIIDHYEISP